ncbi:MAG: DUF1778 domain-containing protein [Propionibacteriaceae bacterium]|jgi:uncharacterized protein (DUF1778 family)|nr:DUF1778 domain-containing protein [Propionibacteriaceae bacterium]
MAQQLRSRRFETRLDPTTHDLISAAADARGESRSAFVVRAARRAAEDSLRPTGSVSREQALAVLLDGLSEAELSSCPLLSALKR